MQKILSAFITLAVAIVFGVLYFYWLIQPSVLAARIGMARQDMVTLKECIMRYHELVNEFPTTAQGFDVLISKPSGLPAHSRWEQILLKVPIDPWGHRYKYIRMSVNDSTAFVILSSGKMSEDPSDDIILKCSDRR